MSRGYFREPAEKFVPSYQLSGKPYVMTVSVTDAAGGTEVIFPSVTRWIKVTHSANQAITLGFSANGVDATVQNAYITLPVPSKLDETTTGILELRCKSIFLKSASGSKTVSVIAGLTDIPTLDVPLSGSKGVG